MREAWEGEACACAAREARLRLADSELRPNPPASPLSSTAAGAAIAGTGGASSRHHAPLVALLASELGVAPEAIHDFDLCLYDTQVRPRPFGYAAAGRGPAVTAARPLRSLLR